MTGLAQDVRYALRQIRKRPGFTTTVVFTLAMAIGVSTAVFSVIYAMLIRPLPYDRSDRIFSLQTWSPQGYTQPASYPEYLDWRRENHVFSALAAFNSYGANFEGPSGPVAVPKVSGTDNFFEIFGVAPYLGRTFSAGADQPGHRHHSPAGARRQDRVEPVDVGHARVRQPKQVDPVQERRHHARPK